MPWELFLGNAAHRLVAYMYRVKNPPSRGFYNKETIIKILTETGIGDVSRLPQNERNLRPDITDTTRRSVLEIKPWNDRGLMEGRQKVQAYLAALNRAAPPGAGLQYRWTRSRDRFESEAAAYEVGQWVELTAQEMRQYGGWVGKAVDGMVDRRERLESFSGVVGMTIDIVGDVAVGVFSGAVFGQKGSRPGAQQPPAQGAKIIPFPSNPPGAPSAPRPAASGGR